MNLMKRTLFSKDHSLAIVALKRPQFVKHPRPSQSSYFKFEFKVDCVSSRLTSSKQTHNCNLTLEGSTTSVLTT
jgi:hypothetical protein